ncbi:MAG: hypothetical protein NTV06_05890, partial [candidate division Zixibacteria bacterium]|nr:hypothetical protein [candidate division Zixibacteria bacterium]
KTCFLKRSEPNRPKREMLIRALLLIVVALGFLSSAAFRHPPVIFAAGFGFCYSIPLYFGRSSGEASPA